MSSQSEIPEVYRLQDVDIQIENALVMTMNKEREVIENGCVVIKDQNIIDVGKTEAIKKKYRSATNIDMRGNPVLPGFVNTHTHLYQSLLRSPAFIHKANLFDFLEFIYKVIVQKASRQDFYYSAQISCIELIRSGCTCVIDNPGSIGMEMTKGVLHAIDDIGMRGIVGRLLLDRDLLKFGNPVLGNIDVALEETVELINQWKENDRIGVWFQPTNEFNCSDELMDKSSSLAKKHGAGVLTHLHEDIEEVRQWQVMTGYRPIQYFPQKGIHLLNTNLIAAHCVWVDDEDIRVLKETGTHVAHNPLSNLYVAGIAPIPKMVSAGINVSLGSDGLFHDFLEVIKMTALIHKIPSKNPGIFSADQVLEMATINGARAMGLENLIGSIEPGKRADLVLYDLQQANTSPSLQPVSYLLVYNGKNNNVDSVIIDGKFVMRDKKIITVEENEVMAKVQESAKRLVYY